MTSLYLISFFLILITSAVFLILHKNTNAVIIPGLSKQGNRQPTFIIAGLSNSGKTTLFNYLINKTIEPTVTSQEPNINHNFKLPSGNSSIQSSFKLSEFPGHEKLHNLLFDEIKNSTNIKGLIYVLDSSIDPKNLSKVAFFLYEILTLTERRPGGVDILIACNKSDLFSSRPTAKIRESLELEIDSIRKLNSSNISKVDNSNDVNNDNDDDFSDLGQSTNQAFKFAKLEGNLDVLSGSVLKQKIESWECWIDERSVN